MNCGAQRVEKAQPLLDFFDTLNCPEKFPDSFLIIRLLRRVSLSPDLSEGAHTVMNDGLPLDGVEQRCNAEIDLIRQTLRQTDGNKAKAARLLGIDRTVLYRKLKKYHIVQTP